MSGPGGVTNGRTRVALLRAVCLCVLGTAAFVGPVQVAQRVLAQEQPPVAERITAVLQDIEKTAYQLARKKQGPAVQSVLALLAQLGDDAVRVEKLRTRCDRTLGLPGKPKPDIEKEVDELRAAAAALSGFLDELTPEARVELARKLVAFDDSLPAPHRALGRTLHGGQWIDADMESVFARRGVIEAALQQARHLEIPISVEESPAAPILDAFGRKGIVVRWRTVSLHSGTIAATRLERILRESIRAYSLAYWLRTGKFEAPPTTQPLHWVFHDSRADHLRALDAAVAKEAVDPKSAADVRETGTNWIDSRGYNVALVQFETHGETSVLRDLWLHQFNQQYRAWADEDIQPCLLLGHLNWVSERYIGTRIRGWDWWEGVERERGRTSDRRTREEERLLRLASTGIAGVREFLKHLARKGEDPAWARSFVDHAGEVAGEDLLKSMLVVEYLQERGDFPKVLLGTLKQDASLKLFEDAVGSGMPEFEQEWRRWLLQGERGVSLLARLEAGDPDADESGQPPVVNYLNGLREQALGARHERVRIEPSLADGCVSHARYLALNPEQARAWPDAHEEYPGRPGFSPEGVRGGGRSNIAPGSSDHVEAIDGWMATYYHRLPMLDPGLLRIGWGLESGYAVLDTGSMVEETYEPTLVVWPPRAGKDIPLGFQLELPSPLPGADQSLWGYPVTVQTFGEFDGLRELDITLLEGGKNGTPVDCIVSTPSAPSNPVLATPGAWCLIPKARLLPGTMYTIRIEGLPPEPKLDTTSTFTTISR